MFSLNLSEVLGSLSLLTLFPQFLEAGFRLNVVRREPPCRCVRILRSPPSVELNMKIERGHVAKALTHFK